jgi:hypothetical protein
VRPRRAGRGAHEISRPVALFIVAWSMVQSCIFFEMSIEDRIAQFADDLNSTDRSQAYLNFHPDLTADYNELKSPALTFDVKFPTDNIPYSITGLDTNGSSVTGTMIHRYDGSGSLITLEMAKLGSDWQIRSLIYGSVTIE